MADTGVSHLIEGLRAPLYEQRGRLVGAVGTTLRVRGVRGRIGDVVEIQTLDEETPLGAEVVGFEGENLLLTPLGELRGVASNSEVILREMADRIPANDSLLGRVLGANGVPIDGAGPVQLTPDRLLIAPTPSPMDRQPIERPLESGIRAVDALLTLGEGQRMGIFAAAGGGKSTLLAMLARQANADAIVIGLIGERGREVREFIEDALGERGLARSVVVVATSDQPAMERVRAARAATAIAEGFRAQGKHVLLLMDSVTRYARALREIGLAAGEPAVRRGLPPSVFAELPRLFERAGSDAHGAITALYTVLTEGEEEDPVGEEVRSLLDGHIHLSRSLGARGHYPAIDIGSSQSRLFRKLAGSGQVAAAEAMRAMLAKLDDIELLLQMGEYKEGQDPLADAALAQRDAIEAFLRQRPDEPSDAAATLARLRSIGEAIL
ncbi:FliI/YscN family ATPase [Qipengyuania sp. DGS5-3]|uniref:FliI/YscN family ATPase n=1 Tax=Qipengyuania sp. DGS5-3 TaxID=3349632 RepID=UPI0036D3A404